MKTKILSQLCIYSIISIFVSMKAYAQTPNITYKAVWGTANYLIFSDVSNLVVPYGFEMEISGLTGTDVVDISKITINTRDSLGTNTLRDLTQLFSAGPTRVSKLVELPLRDSSVAAVLAAPSLGTLSFNNGYIEVTGFNKSYGNGKYYFYLGLYVDQNNFITRKNTLGSKIDLTFQLAPQPTDAKVNGTPVNAAAVVQLPAVNPFALSPQVKNFFMGAIYHWQGGTSTDWKEASNWKMQEGANTLSNLTISVHPSAYDICNIGEFPYPENRQPILSSSTLIYNLYFYPTQKIELSIINTPPATTTLQCSNDFFQLSPQAGVVPPQILGNGTLDVTRLNIGFNGDNPQSNTNDNTLIVSSKITCTAVSIRPHANQINTLVFKGADLIVKWGLTSTIGAGGTAKFSIKPDGTNSRLSFSYPTPLDVTTRRDVGFPARVVTNGLGVGNNILDFDNPGATVRYAVDRVGNYPPGRYPELSLIYASHPNVAGGFIQYKHLETNTNTSFETTAGTLKISGNLTIKGSSNDLTTSPSRTGNINFVKNNTTVELNGAGNQTVQNRSANNGDDIVFNNLIVSGSGTKTLTFTPLENVPSGGFAISPNGILTMAGTATLATGNLLTLKSDATGSASVAAIPTGTVVTGNVNVERFITGGSSSYRAYRLISSPVKQAVNNSNIDMRYVGNAALTAGPGGAASGFTIANANPTMYVYKETEVAPDNTTFNSGKYKGIEKIYATGNIDINGGIMNKNIPVGNGFMFYFVGDNKTLSGATSRIPENTVITAQGYLNQGDLNVQSWITGNSNLSFTMAAGSTAGMNLIGNPYAATLDLNTFVADNPNIKTSITQLRNQNPGQNYVVYDASGSSGPSANRYIASGQGFFVSAKNAATSITFKENQKAPTVQLTGPQLFMGDASDTQQPITGFYLKMEQNEEVYDYCGIYFREDWSSKFDDNDAVDLDGSSPQVFLSSYSSDGIRTAINRYPGYKHEETIKLYVNAAAGGSFKLKIEDIRNIDPRFDIWLKDYFLNKTVNIRDFPSYAFDIDKNVAASLGGERFELFAKRKPLPLYQLLTFNGEQASAGIQIYWTTTNEADYTWFVLEKLNSNNEYLPIYQIKSNGSGSYTFMDKLPDLGSNTYRLKQIDPFEDETYSDVITINYRVGNAQNARLAIYPNPAIDRVTVDLAEKPASALSMTIIDGKGNILDRKTITEQSSNHQVGQLPTGTYVIKMIENKSGKVIAAGKLVKL